MYVLNECRSLGIDKTDKAIHYKYPTLKICIRMTISHSSIQVKRSPAVRVSNAVFISTIMFSINFTDYGTFAKHFERDLDWS